MRKHLNYFLASSWGLSWFFAEARSWKKIEIPGAVCGNGATYTVFLDEKASDKLLIEFMGGGSVLVRRNMFRQQSTDQIRTEYKILVRA